MLEYPPSAHMNMGTVTATALADVDHVLTVCQANMNEQQVFTQYD